MSAEIRVCPWCGSYFRALSHCQRDGQELVETDGVIDRYRITDRIGEGGMGAVYSAEHTLLDNRTVAVKMLHREHVRDKALVRRFFREAKAASSVDNEHIVQVVDFGVTEGGDSFLVMEHVEGRCLRDVIDDEAPLTLPRAFSIGVQIAEGLYAAHRQGIVHRDLKPENVLLVASDSPPTEFVKLLDFGIAQLSDYQDARITRAGMILGTPAYMSPEQASGEPVDQRADIYALGTILYEMLVGHCPFEGKSAKDVLIAQLTRTPVPPRQLRADIPASIERVILRCLNKDPEQRPKTMMYQAYELRDALRQTGSVPAMDDLEEEEPGFAAGEASGELFVADKLPRRINPRQLLWAAGVVGGMVLGILITLLIVGGNGDDDERAQKADGGAKTSDAARAMVKPDAAPPPPKVDPPPKHTRKSAKRRTKRSTKIRHRPRTPKTHVQPKNPPPPAAASATSVKVTSIPSGAKVFDGRHLLGRTPLKVGTGTARVINVFREGYADKVVRLKKGQTRKVTARLSKRMASWDVLSFRQLKKLRDSGQISRFTYDRRKKELERKRDKKLVKLRVEHKMGHWTLKQYERQRKAIIDSYR